MSLLSLILIHIPFEPENLPQIGTWSNFIARQANRYLIGRALQLRDFLTCLHLPKGLTGARDGAHGHHLSPSRSTRRLYPVVSIKLVWFCPPVECALDAPDGNRSLFLTSGRTRALWRMDVGLCGLGNSSTGTSIQVVKFHNPAVSIKLAWFCPPVECPLNAPDGNQSLFLTDGRTRTLWRKDFGLCGLGNSVSLLLSGRLILTGWCRRIIKSTGTSVQAAKFHKVSLSLQYTGTIDMPPYAPVFSLADFDDQDGVAILQRCRRRIAELEAQVEKEKATKKTPGVSERTFTNLGRCIQKVVSMFGSIESLIAENDRRQDLVLERSEGNEVHDEEEEYTEDQIRAFNGYKELISPFWRPSMKNSSGSSKR
ncbi:hypothetical protein DFH07DRAFT_764441 [Mycena maculata]|uniref:Uncharacterized protein n=1 Tax=Mycena maculata TaxID=230809 RepID=A0AAD7KDC0_9AGAR|nr:hypothetical protein DFH07DRAFT_764441 [Mycena maculata]